MHSLPKWGLLCSLLSQASLGSLDWEQGLVIHYSRSLEDCGLETRITGGILKDTLRPPIPERCDPEWRTLMEQCWSTDPEARPSFTEVTNRLRSMSIAVHAKGQNYVARQTRPGIPV
ncbi:hypothetical protein TEA_000499 [Camellia sinensis var. sinensis]|uniref:Serine-threonine/tyrosine-protein kinase catalytic domain-containing protein n=1 Tax=Camellia sinensis var. sinensis TaxID=542762 RepID=A0A4S4DCH7_CAMSN|nr:hypothetical protein TEA_000499 [Camellia sinensis var. sinensis]